MKMCKTCKATPFLTESRPLLNTSQERSDIVYTTWRPLL